MTDAIGTFTAWTPDTTLAADLARVLGDRLFFSLPGLAQRAARAALADPAGASAQLAPAFVSIEELVFALRPAAARTAIAPNALLAVADLINVIECIGAPLRSTCTAIAQSWLGGLDALRGAQRLRVAMAAFAWNDLELASKFLGTADLSAGYDRAARYHGDLRAAVRHVMAASQAGDKLWAVEGMLESVFLAATELALDEPTLLWLVRLVFHDVGHAQLADVTSKSHRFVRDVLADRDDRANRRPEAPEFPLNRTLDHGTYCIDDHVAGEGFQRLYLGHRTRDDARVLIAMDMASKHDREALTPTLARRGSNVLELVFVGEVDGDPDHHWASVELAPEGDWLPHLLPRGDRIDVSNGVNLARSVGRILEANAAAGSLLAHVRPEYMWAQARGDRVEVIAVSDRGDAVTSNPTGDGAIVPMFDRDYLAPEVEMDRADERSLVFTLAAMTSEWLTGRYPFASTWRLHPDGPRHGKPLPLEPQLPPQLASLLRRALSRDPAARPTLARFVDQLGSE